MENFDNVKVGDKVIVVTNWGLHIKEVTHVTPKRFKVGNDVFNKCDGSEYGNGYSFTICKHVTDILVNEVARQEEFAKMRRILRNVNVNSYNYEQTKKLYDFMLENSLIIE
jgi:hypothetical protein